MLAQNADDHATNAGLSQWSTLNDDCNVQIASITSLVYTTHTPCGTHGSATRQDARGMPGAKGSGKNASDMYCAARVSPVGEVVLQQVQQCRHLGEYQYLLQLKSGWGHRFAPVHSVNAETDGDRPSRSPRGVLARRAKRLLVDALWCHCSQKDNDSLSCRRTLIVRCSTRVLAFSGWTTSAVDHDAASLVCDRRALEHALSRTVWMPPTRHTRVRSVRCEADSHGLRMPPCHVIWNGDSFILKHDRVTRLPVASSLSLSLQLASSHCKGEQWYYTM